jgi:chromate transporter
LLLPSVTVALIIARLLVRFKESKYVESALYGLRPASLGLISAAGLTVFSLVLFGAEIHSLIGEGFSLFDYRTLILAAALFIATNLYKKAHPILFLAISAVVGIFIF